MPDAPTDLVVVQPGGSQQLDLSWGEVTDAEYNVYRNGVQLAGPLADREYSDTEVTYDQQYIYAVTAVVEDEESEQSIPVAATAVSANPPFATIAELEAFWKDLTGPDEPRAGVLLSLASNRLRMIGENVGVDVDARAAASAAYASTLQWVVMESTKRALLTPTDQLPVDTYSQTAGPYSENYKYTNPSGDLWFKKSELSALGLYGNQTLSSISTSQDLYGYSIYSS